MNRRQRRVRQREQVRERSAYLAAGKPVAAARPVPTREERRKAEAGRVLVAQRRAQYEASKVRTL